MIKDMHAGAASSRRLLFHTYHFPPIGGSGAQRPLKLVRSLAGLGYEAIVVTGAGATADRWAPEDATLLDELPAGVEVHRLSRAAEPDPPGRWRSRGERWLGAPNRWARWWVDASTQLGSEVGEDADVIYVWMQPYASAEAGVALSRTLGRPWVADLGDPWAIDEMMVYPSRFHRRRELRRMGRLLGTASAIVLSTSEAVTRFQLEFRAIAESTPILAIPNGFDPDDFQPRPPRVPDGKFRIVHTGYLHTELGRQQLRHGLVRRLLGGSVPGLEILTRSHIHLVEAIGALLARRPELEQVLELHLAGVLTEADREVAARCRVATLHGYLTHAESIALMQRADLLFLPMQNLSEGTRATIVPGKTYEYLASGTPILGAVPEGDARDLLLETGNAAVVRPDDAAGIAAAIERSIEEARAGKPPAPPDSEVVSRFEYGRLAERLAEVFDGVLGGSAQGAPAADVRTAERTSRTGGSDDRTMASGRRPA